jgi:hypothetical protein
MIWNAETIIACQLLKQARQARMKGWCGAVRALVSDDNILPSQISSCQETDLQGMRQRSYASAAAV